VFVFALSLSKVASDCDETQGKAVFGLSERNKQNQEGTGQAKNARVLSYRRVPEHALRNAIGAKIAEIENAGWDALLVQAQFCQHRQATDALLRQQRENDARSCHKRSKSVFSFISAACALRGRTRIRDTVP
jgi:hypothetical protein